MVLGITAMALGRGKISMWNYEKRLEYPIKISQPNPKIAMDIMSQLGGPDGETGAAVRYLCQRYTMPYRQVQGLLTDIGTEASNCFLIIWNK